MCIQTQHPHSSSADLSIGVATLPLSASSQGYHHMDIQCSLSDHLSDRPNCIAWTNLSRVNLRKQSTIPTQCRSVSVDINNTPSTNILSETFSHQPESFHNLVLNDLLPLQYINYQWPILSHRSSVCTSMIISFFCYWMLSPIAHHAKTWINVLDTYQSVHIHISTLSVGTSIFMESIIARWFLSLAFIKPYCSSTRLIVSLGKKQPSGYQIHTLHLPVYFARTYFAMSTNCILSSAMDAISLSTMPTVGKDKPPKRK